MSASVTSLPTITAEARVSFNLDLYFGLAMKVISPGWASSMEATPEISTSPSPMTAPPTYSASSLSFFSIITSVISDFRFWISDSDQSAICA